ncbi:sialic acid-binding Ig-like lectin 16 [Cheilinus undulatus]|uniref:sialic acid-binding Ig-like lectin 16 n=1 Tax=Cheilinus undulatus TaxID=241271 RepID=UPI001BD2373D|nr:sialic acid-binding Ig-like lectin 16 [Cheilinus undulatus]
MALIFLVFLLFLELRSCQLQCVKETLNPKELSLEMPSHIQEVSGECIHIPYEVTFPKNKANVPHKRIWFRGDPHNTVETKEVKNAESRTKDVFRIRGLPAGEFEYGLKVEWECNQTYVFPTRVRVSVSALTESPRVFIPDLEEGRLDSLLCFAPRLCSARPKIHWTLTTADGKNTPLSEKYYEWERGRDLHFRPTAHLHNSNITCVVEYDNNLVTTRTATLNVRFAPRILNGSQCVVKGKQLVCVCISRGNPPSPITWPLASLTDFSVTSYSSGLTVDSTISMPAADYHNTSITCISSNRVGQTQREIPIRNQTVNFKSDEKQSSSAALIWITAVSVSLNLVLLISLIVCIHKRGKTSQEKPQEEMNTYASLNRAQVEQDYSVISPKRN